MCIWRAGHAWERGKSGVDLISGSFNAWVGTHVLHSTFYNTEPQASGSWVESGQVWYATAWSLTFYCLKKYMTSPHGSSPHSRMCLQKRGMKGYMERKGLPRHGTEKQCLRWPRSHNVTQEHMSWRNLERVSRFPSSPHPFHWNTSQGMQCSHPRCPRSWTFSGQPREERKGTEGVLEVCVYVPPQSPKALAVKCTDIPAEGHSWTLQPDTSQT